MVSIFTICSGIWYWIPILFKKKKKKKGESSYSLWLRKKIKLLSVPLWMPVLHKTRNPCFCPCDFVPSFLYQERAWDYFPTVLNFSVCLKCKSVSRVFCGVLWPPIFSTKWFATILRYQWRVRLPLWAGPPALGIVCAQRGSEASDNLP